MQLGRPTLCQHYLNIDYHISHSIIIGRAIVRGDQEVAGLNGQQSIVSGHLNMHIICSFILPVVGSL